MAPPGQIGGEIGEIRASIDIAKLNEYLTRHVRAIHAPVTVKQFKVRNGRWYVALLELTQILVRSGRSGLVVLNPLLTWCRERTCIVEPYVFPDGRKVRS